MQNPVHTYALPGNYTVSLNVTNDDGSNTITRPGYIAVTNLPPTTATTKPTSTVTNTVTPPVTKATTRPTPTTTHASLPVWVPVAGIVCAMLAARSDDVNEVGWYYDNSDKRTYPVGELEPNELGIYGMSAYVS